MSKLIKTIKEKIIHFKMRNIKVKGSWKINEDFSIDVWGDVNIAGHALNEIPVKFNVVTGNFDCAFNNLKSLFNSPREVGGDFSCESNHIVDLKFAPIHIGKNFLMGHNLVNTFNYFPEFVGGNSSFMDNPINNIDTLPFSKNLNSMVLTCDKNKVMVYTKEDFILRDKQKEITDLNNDLSNSLNQATKTIQRNKLKI